MRRSEAARLARWSAIIALVLTAAVAGIYFYRSWQAASARSQAPAAVPPAVEKQMAAIEFSRTEGNREIFTVRASRSTEFREGERNQLEDVWITIFGHQGERMDRVHARACDYLKSQQRLTCQGDVQIELESAEDSRRHPGQRILRIETANLTFDSESGRTHTDQAVRFRFPGGEGRATGMTYSAREALAVLQRDVELRLAHSQTAAPTGGVVLAGQSLTLQHRDRTLRLAGARVKHDGLELAAGSLTVQLDAKLRPQRLVASQTPRLTQARGTAQLSLAAETLTARFDSAGQVERLEAEGRVNALRKQGERQERLEAERAEVEIEPKRNGPRLVTAAGNVRVHSEDSHGSRRLETSSLRIWLATNGPARMERAEAAGRSRLEWERPGEVTRVGAQQLETQFAEDNRMRLLVGRGGVEVERRVERAVQRGRSDEVAVAFGAGNEWSAIEQKGHVRLQEGERNAEAEHALWSRANDTVALTGSAVVSDALTRTAAEAIYFHQRTGHVVAEGRVRTTYLSAERTAANLAAEPAHLAAGRMVAIRDTGRALYSGRARLWQGEAALEADTVEVLRAESRLEARGRVMALFPQAAHPKTRAGKRALWRISAGVFTYWSTEGRARLERQVWAQSEAGQIQAQTLELWFATEGTTREWVRGVATGGVNIRQGTRRAIAERCEYFVGEGKFVLSGGSPTLQDASRGTTRGRKLTFFLADDRIVVDSEEGSRTLTLHRVEK